MNRVKIGLMFCVLVFSVAVSGCGTAGGSAVATGEDADPTGKAVVADHVKTTEPAEETEKGELCNNDADCVPAQCCHPRTCVSKDHAPDCAGAMCTLDCRGGTMDCGGGGCVCVDGQCSVKMNPPKIPGGGDLKPE